MVPCSGVFLAVVGKLPVRTLNRMSSRYPKEVSVMSGWPGFIKLNISSG